MFLEKLSQNLSSKELLATLTEENKNKSWSLSPISVSVDKKGLISTNAKELRIIVEEARMWAEEGGRDTQEIKDKKEVITVLRDWFKGTRLEVTKPLDNAKKELISNENILSDIVKDLARKEDELNEALYKEREDALTLYIQEQLQEHQDMDISISIFSDFVQRKRKTNILTSKSLELTKKVKDDFSRILDDVIRPIIEEQRKKALLLSDLERLALDMQGRDLAGLEDLLQQIGIRYVHAEATAHVQITSAIKAKKLELSTIKEIESDNELLGRATIISKNETVDEGEIEDMIETLLGIQAEVAREESRRVVSAYISTLQNTLTRIVFENQKNSTKQKTTYMLDLEDLERVCSIEYEAYSADEAKKQIIETLTSMVQIITLKIKE
ncbi:MAG TPA: hypothetical protein EYG70_06600 [Sulfurimonas sp.]|nr:hypothetical protein [Sulfurimonas sp.]